MKCPKCGSIKIGQYRMPTGAIWCDDCGFRVEQKEIYNPFQNPGVWQELNKLKADRQELLEALDTLTLVVGLTPIAGNKDALQEAMDIARAVIAKHKAEKEG